MMVYGYMDIWSYGLHGGIWIYGYMGYKGGIWLYEGYMDIWVYGSMVVLVTSGYLDIWGIWIYGLHGELHGQCIWVYGYGGYRL